ncbi:MAG TPA: aromatic amino acid ammonia-lyase, partial [Leptospiraceae bacterium]|nr:aromatic amino acid ammonia-lyase [Leptospiraceae bacterium]
MKDIYILENKNLSLEEFSTILEKKKEIVFSGEVLSRVKKSNSFLDSLLANKVLLYGINTGYGPLATTHLPLSQAKVLQKNLIYHLSTGVGETLSPIYVRASMLARLICLSKGYSGVSLKSITRLKDFLNQDIIPYIPKIGTVGASGDLTPLAHMTLALIGESKVFYKGKLIDSKIVHKNLKWKPLQLGPKDGLAFVNGTSVMTGISAVNGILSKRVIQYSIILSLLYAEILQAKEEAFFSVVARLKPHPGIQAFITQWLQYSQDSKRFKKRKQFNNIKETSYENELLQDPYTIRTIPQTIGAVIDVLDSHNKTIEIELNSISDNPIFVEEDEAVIHAGNFQGYSISLAADNLYNALVTIAIHSERKIARITDNKLNGGLPNFLQKNQNGLHSGFMGAQV